ncbi:MAG: DUF4262 domain-containing protein [Pseudomonadota bacterium]
MSADADYKRELLANVERHGWQLTYVFDPDGNEPDFAYSVGFTKTLDAPEFILFGLPREVMAHMLGEIYEQLQGGNAPADGRRWQNLLQGFDCISRKAAHPDLYSEYVTSADWFWRDSGNHGHPEVYQIVWPSSKTGLFPWEDGCHQDVIDAQPRLWRA